MRPYGKENRTTAPPYRDAQAIESLLQEERRRFESTLAWANQMKSELASTTDQLPAYTPPPAKPRIEHRSPPPRSLEAAAGHFSPIFASSNNSSRQSATPPDPQQYVRVVLSPVSQIRKDLMQRGLGQVTQASPSRLYKFSFVDDD